MTDAGEKLRDWSWSSFWIGYAKGGAIGVGAFILMIAVYWLLRWLV